MASLQKESTGKFHIVIFHDGKRHKRSLGTKKRSHALARKEEIEEVLDLVKRGRLTVPAGVTVVDFAMADGKIEPQAPVPETQVYAPAPIISQPTVQPVAQKPFTLQELMTEYFDSIPDGSLEQNTLDTMHTHEDHLLRLLPPNLDLNTLTGKHLQGYINKRAKEPTQRIVDKSVPKRKQVRVRVSATTIRKEIVTLGSAWRWADSMEMLSRKFPNRGLRWPKTDEKPPFQTWDEIERQIEQDELLSSEAELLWDCLYLRYTEVEQLLKYVKEHARYPYFYPLFSMAAYTGARRSELVRSRKSDFDFASGTITIRERKRVKGKRSTRRVPICEKLLPVLEMWFADHPGTPFTFASPDRTGNVRQVTLCQDETQFTNTLQNGRWAPIKGWHCLRHSFISNLASAGVDQRIIDDFVGHTTEEMRQRYRHLLPDVKQAALNTVFGANA